MKGHLSYKTTLCGPMGWSPITGFTVMLKRPTSQVAISVVLGEDVGEGVMPVSTTRMAGDGRRLVHHQQVVRLSYYLNGISRHC